MNNKLQNKNNDLMQKSKTCINTDKSIIEQCAQHLLKSYTATNKYNKDKIYNDILNHIRISFIDNFIHSLITEKSFKHLIDMGGTDIDYYIIDYFKKDNQLIEKNSEYELSNTLAIECFNYIEKHYETFNNMSDFLDNNYLSFYLFNSDKTKSLEKIKHEVDTAREHYANAYKLIQLAKEKYLKNK